MAIEAERRLTDPPEVLGTAEASREARILAWVRRLLVVNAVVGPGAALVAALAWPLLVGGVLGVPLPDGKWRFGSPDSGSVSVALQFDLDQCPRGPVAVALCTLFAVAAIRCIASVRERPLVASAITFFLVMPFYSEVCAPGGNMLWLLPQGMGSTGWLTIPALYLASVASSESPTTKRFVGLLLLLAAVVPIGHCLLALFVDGAAGGGPGAVASAVVYATLAAVIRLLLGHRIYKTGRGSTTPPRPHATASHA